MTTPVGRSSFELYGFAPLKIADTEKAPGNKLKSMLVTLTEMRISQVFIHKGANFL